MSWKIKIAKKALKELKRIPKKDAKRLLFTLEELIDNPYRGDIEKIKGEDNTYRRRVGNYRVLYEILSKEKYIEVFDIRRRTTTTYRK
ncbi:type II toxin-antitoxin system RelE/ParE family toxin [Patescibacteria group bacterium]|nr:type II toxin-antitoxin system RelE/ParE family toxin [Patescibacteria group bacterium]